ncbi:hypothetical protein [Yoonia sp. 208BN28-4]|uniref:hypothetical protein n=1 Tax=Yoonia sp. 208BN28-4 TaxID=3126505 RepID=UPI003099F6C3
MSAPQTDVEKQAKRHKGPLAGIMIGLIVAGLLFVGYITWLSYNSDEPDATTPAEVLSDEEPAADN